MSFSCVEQAVSFSTVGGRRLIKWRRASNSNLRNGTGIWSDEGKEKTQKKKKKTVTVKGWINICVAIMDQSGSV